MIAIALGLTSLGVALASFIGLVWLSVAMFDDHWSIPVMMVALWSFLLWGVLRFVRSWRAETRALRARAAGSPRSARPHRR